MIRKNLRNGFTMLEIIFVVIAIGILVGLFFPNIITSKNKTEISSTIANDAKLIVQAVTEWKGTSSDSDGSYSNLDTEDLVPYLPNTMIWDNTNIKSSGLNSGIKYQVISDITITNGDSFKILINFTDTINSKNLDDRIILYAETNAMDTLKSISTDKTNATNISDATAIGSANDVFTTGGTTKDGICGVRKLKF